MVSATPAFFCPQRHLTTNSELHASLLPRIADLFSDSEWNEGS